LKAISWKLVVVVAVVLAAIIYVLPTINPSLWPHKKINLGLDLQGGMNMRLKVLSQEAVKNTTDRIAQEIKGGLKEKKIRYRSIESTDDARISVVIKGSKYIEDFEAYIEKEYPDLVGTDRKVSDGALTLFLDLSDEDAEDIRTMAVEQALETIRNRIDQFGVSEPLIQRQGEETIIVQLPGIKDAKRARDLVGKTAMLEFKLVDETLSASQVTPGSLPADREILQGKDGRSYVVYKKALLTGDYLTEARIDLNNQYGEIRVGIELNKKGAKLFEEITTAHVNEPLAIVLDDKVQCAPNIDEPIPGGSAVIRGGYTMEEATDLAIVLRAGSLPAPMELENETTVGPSLGSDSIRMGLMSIYIGGILVVLFMIIYYRFSGLVADFALVVNILLIAAGLAAFQATLTLPGIAGIILTIGMAVDANVLIFERIREELDLGKTPRAAIEAGYDRATLTILDANITTLIAALVLFQFGTGPIKGFAVTLSLGVVASVFTSLILTRSLFDLYLSKRKIKQLSI
jgi:preprotein translocase subunit SecD